MRKILEIAPYAYLPYFSGGQKSIAQYLEYLGNESELSVITVIDNENNLAKSYRTFPLLKKASSRYLDFSLYFKMKKLIKKEKYDLLVWEHPYFAWLAWMIKKSTGITTIVHTHNIEYDRFKSTGRWWWPILKRYEGWFLKFSDYAFFKTQEDLEFAFSTWNIRKEKCKVVPFGIPIKEVPADRQQCRKRVIKLHHLKADEKIFLFNGLLDYKPNLDALKVILDDVNPILLKTASFSYKIIICGKRLPAEMNELKEYSEMNIIYAGFVEDIELYFKASDLFLNTVQSGGGIKTKMVEAIGYGTTVISTKTGATGIDKEACGNKLVVIEDNDWPAFANAVIADTGKEYITPSSYYEKYYWGEVVKTVISAVNISRS